MTDELRQCIMCDGAFEDDPIVEIQFRCAGHEPIRMTTGTPQAPLRRCPTCVPNAIDVVMTFADLLGLPSLKRAGWTEAVVMWASGKEESVPRAQLAPGRN